MQTPARATAILFLLSATVLTAGDWPSFRGPANNGIADEPSAPLRWTANDNVAWKAPLPRPANGSPIVSAGQVFVSSAEDEAGTRRSLYCFDAVEGKKLWVRTVKITEQMPTHRTNPYGGTTPVSNGERVVVWHASAGLHCYSLDGDAIWSRDLGEFRHMWGYGTSPILYDGKVILNSGPGKRVFLTAINLENGATLWKTDEPFEGDGDYNENGKYLGSWSTPVVTEVDGKCQVICVMPKRVNGATEFTRQCLAEALAEKVQRGELLEEHAKRIGRQIMRENALKLFPKLNRMLWRKDDGK